MGVDHPDQLTPDMIFHRNEYAKAVPLSLPVDRLAPHQLLGDNIPESYAPLWEAASAERF